MRRQAASDVAHHNYLVAQELRRPLGNHWNSRGHFFAAAAMRRILVENARRKKRARHGGGLQRVEIELANLRTRMPPEDLLALDEALEQLRQEDPKKAQLVTLRYFAGMTIEEASQALGISRVTAHRYWTYARAWLHRRIKGGAAVAAASPAQESSVSPKAARAA